MLDSTDHYENFPVGSWLVPAVLRPALAAIYRFARFADDVADEGQAEPEERLKTLQRLDSALRLLGEHPVVTPLFPHIRTHDLGTDPFRRLLSAFQQDVVTSRYTDMRSLLDYCHRSADPVGELMLRLFSAASGRDLLAGQRLLWSDKICSSLQLINFLQDMSVDWEKRRIYLPASIAAANGLTPAAFEAVIDQSHRLRGIPDTSAGRQLRQAIRDFHTEASRLMHEGRPLLGAVPLRLSLELRAICAGGQTILDLLETGQYDPFRKRPKLGASCLPLLLRNAVVSRRQS